MWILIWVQLDECDPRIYSSGFIEQFLSWEEAVQYLIKNKGLDDERSLGFPLNDGLCYQIIDMPLISDYRFIC